MYLIFGIKVENNILNYLDYKTYNNDLLSHILNLHKAITLSSGMFSGAGSNIVDPIGFSEFLGNVEMLIGLIIVGIGVGTVTRKIVR